MPKSVTYKSGAIIYFEGDKADRIYVLQEGFIDIISPNIAEETASVHNIIKAGEFFGVKSAMLGHPRDDAATVVQDSKVMIFTLPEFEAFCMRNPRIVVAMLKAFSNQLRRVNRELAVALKQKDADPDDGLYNMAEFFMRQKKHDKAYYVLKRYMEQFPQGRNIENAGKNFSTLEKMGIKI